MAKGEAIPTVMNSMVDNQEGNHQSGQSPSRELSPDTTKVKERVESQSNEKAMAEHVENHAI